MRGGGGEGREGEENFEISIGIVRKSSLRVEKSGIYCSIFAV